MAIAVVALVGLFVSAYLSFYKLGYLGIIACGEGGCEVVQSSQYAVFLGVPVALWGVVGYAAIFVVAMIGVQPRWLFERWVALTLLGLSAAGLAFSAYLTFLEAFVIHAWCRWCVVSAVLITLIFLLSIPGLRYAR